MVAAKITKNNVWSHRNSINVPLELECNQSCLSARGINDGLYKNNSNIFEKGNEHVHVCSNKFYFQIMLNGKKQIRVIPPRDTNIACNSTTCKTILLVLVE